MTDWLIDTSAVARLSSNSDVELWAQRMDRGLVRIATVTRLEIGYSARSGADLRSASDLPPLGSMPVEYQTPATEDRAMEVQGQLAGLTVLHVDKDFELIAEIPVSPSND